MHPICLEDSDNKPYLILMMIMIDDDDDDDWDWDNIESTYDVQCHCRAV